MPQQHGGRCDSLIMALSIIVNAQLRLSSNLPTLIKKGDLWQGFDLTWRSACLLQLHVAFVQGQDGLLQDAAFRSDEFQVKLLHLVGPLQQLANVGLGQGKRSSVHLFNLVAKGLADMATMSPAVGLGLLPMRWVWHWKGLLPTIRHTKPCNLIDCLRSLIK